LTGGHGGVAGEPCSADQSLCNGRNEMCIGRGPEWDADDHGYKSNIVIATKQFERAQSLWSGNITSIQGAPPTARSIMLLTRSIGCWREGDMKLLLLFLEL
jgi:hypothetical protein